MRYYVKGNGIYDTDTDQLIAHCHNNKYAVDNCAVLNLAAERDADPRNQSRSALEAAERASNGGE